MSVRPVFASEKLLAGFDGQPPFKGCGLSSFATLAALATNNEALIENGWPIGKARRTALLKTGWRAFTRVADSNGIPDRDDGLRIWRAMFPALPDPTPVQTRDRAQVKDDMDRGLALSMAMRLSALPANSRWREYTSADHQATWWDRKAGTVQRQDPMHGHSDRYRGERLSLDEGLDAAEAIENGLILYWTAPVGGWTAARLQTAKLRKSLGEARDDFEDVEALAVTRGKIINRQDETIADLRRQLDERPTGNLDAGWEAALVAAISRLETLRTQGPPE